MDRRKFLLGAGTLLTTPDLASVLPNDLHSSHEGRLVLPINRNWRFSPTLPLNGHSPTFNDSHLQQITLPHTNIRLPWHSFDEKRYEFVSFYRRRFRLPPGLDRKRVFLDFAGVMCVSRVWINGNFVGEYKGGYTPFSFELTQFVDFDNVNFLSVEVDSRERPDVPPFGNLVDYMTFGGIYRTAELRIVSSVYIQNIFAHSPNVLSSSPSLDVDCYLDHDPTSKGLTIEVALSDQWTTLARASGKLVSLHSKAPLCWSLSLENLSGVTLWNLHAPHLYTVTVRLRDSQGVLLDEAASRIGFREALFTDHGFSLNGEVVKLRGLNRHQTYPFVGPAMPARIQKQDARILKNQFHCNVVRTSHYPQSPDFLDACDELGLLVVEEIPGWQHIGDDSWKELSIDNLRRMIWRDWNRPSIILWGVRINESNDDHKFYSTTNAVARQLDPTRQTGGVRYKSDSEFLEDVFTMNDFGWPLAVPKYNRYLNTEFVGHTYPVKQIDDNERHREHTLRHARIHDQLAANAQYAGGIGWCAFDYNTHRQFGAGDRICYHGVADIFREPKPAASFYKSQVDPLVNIVLEPAFHWASGDEALRFQTAVICSNCDQLKLYICKDEAWIEIATVNPDRERFPNLRYPPFSVDLNMTHGRFGDLKIQGYLSGQLAITTLLSASGLDKEFYVLADDSELCADGSDCTRVSMRVCDEFGNVRPYANDAISLRVEGPAELIGDNPFVLFGGRGAVWIRAGETSGTVRLLAEHPRFGVRSVTIRLIPAPKEVA